MAPESKLPVYSREVAHVGDYIIKEDRLRFRLRLELNKFAEMNPDTDKKGKIVTDEELQEALKTVLENMIKDYMIISYGEKKGIEISNKDLVRKFELRKKKINPKVFENLLNEKNIPYSRYRQMVETQIRVQHIMDKELAKDINVTLADVRNYYYKHGSDFRVQERVRVRQIVMASLDKAQEIYDRLSKGENFAKLAINHSISPDRAQGGDLGYFAKGTFPKEFDEACFKLKKGEMSPIVKSDYGYHIFKVLDKKYAGKKQLLEVAPEIQDILYNEKLEVAYDRWMKEIKGSIKVTINEEVLENFNL